MAEPDPDPDLVARLCAALPDALLLGLVSEGDYPTAVQREDGLIVVRATLDPRRVARHLAEAATVPTLPDPDALKHPETKVD